MSPETRSRVMARIKSRNTSPEKMIFAGLEDSGIPFVRHANDLPGQPDLVFPKARLAVFIDGDFWHGWRFPLWEHKLDDKWRDKIAATRRRDQRNFRKMRRRGWKVLRLWEHQIEKDPKWCVERIIMTRERLLKDLRSK